MYIFCLSQLPRSLPEHNPQSQEYSPQNIQGLVKLLPDAAMYIGFAQKNVLVLY